MRENKKGSALLLTTILLFVVLSMVISLTYITVMEQKMSGKTKSSVGSFFNADSGVEWALNRIANADSDITIATAFGDSDIADGVTCPFPGCNLYFLDENGKVISDGNTFRVSDIKAVRSVGTNETGDPTQRAIEAAVAETGIGKYQISCSLSGALTMCCRVDTETGSTECKMTPDHPNPWITFGNKPW
ncbi:MAG: putative exported protein [Candidatus Moranbacteria bacterium GW2011_GWC1_45_18]|nr:MAG: putative exported protein [Candidatus Moranbacteria bacterium GW2011_GWC2_40_12]KKT32821.1 MAG: putative exported protein [Candidatus Moranbacteria bacterium GW2011_GWF2_44_10]KKT70337.1 MAG: putative exported protein [Candidatus Moranbacteria bacterium GW2011_GWF1_44_4]KKT99848.1 MAG: putative exported protein [Candidatus Moranbacteria bacterium GW2011_GWC1_45_18]OGI23956.1 MAG: hypothetical protein A2194_04600 [Candidatus Moranbacteria bacterium RIFOXYA1_FULL_44_8]OGI40811.1 MAG: hyp